MKPLAVFDNGKVQEEVPLYSGFEFARFSDGIFGVRRDLGTRLNFPHDLHYYRLVGKLVGFKYLTEKVPRATLAETFVPTCMRIEFEYYQLDRATVLT